MREFIVDRSKWCRGGKGGKPMVVPNEHGNMCCLGFVREQCGAQADPDTESAHMIAEWEKLPRRLTVPGGLFARQMSPQGNMLQVVNDDKTMTDASREDQLNELAVDLGFRFVFVDGQK
jgi:hypothetical protein